MYRVRTSSLFFTPRHINGEGKAVHQLAVVVQPIAERLAQRAIQGSGLDMEAFGDIEMDDQGPGAVFLLTCRDKGDRRPNPNFLGNSIAQTATAIGNIGALASMGSRAPASVEYMQSLDGAMSIFVPGAAILEHGKPPTK